MAKLRLTQKANQSADSKKVWTLDDFDNVEDLQTAVADADIQIATDAFWTGFKLVTRAKTGFNAALDRLKIKYTVTDEAVTKSKESDAEVIARMLGIDVSAVTPDLIAKVKTLI